jgi:hypothetical protein
MRLLRATVLWSAVLNLYIRKEANCYCYRFFLFYFIEATCLGNANVRLISWHESIRFLK